MNTVSLIVGGTGGIGSAVAERFSQEGQRVYATYYREEPPKKPASVDLIQCDIRDEDAARRAIDTVMEKEGRLDVLVNAVTLPLTLEPFERLADETFRAEWEIAVLGNAHLMRAVLPIMKSQRSGTLIFMLSRTITDPAPHMASYISAKAALLALLQSVSRETDRFGIRLIGISPSFVETDLLRAFPQKLLEVEREKLPGKKFLQPMDIAALAVEIINDPKKYPTGKNILV